jgi:MOSC domain-containing protein
MVDVEAPSGEVLAIDDPRLASLLVAGIRHAPALTLVRSDRAITDCRPVSIISLQTIQQLSQELNSVIDERRFRANVYVDLTDAGGFGEQVLVGRSIRIGPKAVISILEHDPRCNMISLDPDTGQANHQILRQVAQAHDGTAGVYAAVLIEGMVGCGDSVELME